MLRNNKLTLGTKVQRLASDYTNGRRGEIVEIDDTKGRARVLWTETPSGAAMKLRTWVRFADLAPIAAEPLKINLEIEKRQRITDTEVASDRLAAARRAAGNRDLSGTVDYIRGWLEAAGTCGTRPGPDEVLHAIAHWIERGNAKQPKHDFSEFVSKARKALNDENNRPDWAKW